MKLSSIDRKQRGAALIVSLVILLSMTLLGVSSMKGTSTQIAMAGNLRESSLAFQAAEAGLRSAEAAILTQSKIELALLLVDDEVAEPDYMYTGSWDNRAKVDIDLSSIGIKQDSTSQPQYMIKFVAENSSDAGTKNLDRFSGYGGYAGPKPTAIFRVTARAGGLSGKIFRTVQSHFGFVY